MLVMLYSSSAIYEVISRLFACRIIIFSPPLNPTLVFSVAEFYFVRKFLLWVNCSNFFEHATRNFNEMFYQYQYV